MTQALVVSAETVFVHRGSAPDYGRFFVGDSYHGKQFEVLRCHNREAHDMRALRLHSIDLASISFACGCEETTAKQRTARHQIEYLWNRAGKPILLDAAIGIVFYESPYFLEWLSTRGIHAVIFAGTIFANRLEAEGDMNQWCLYLYRDARGLWHHNVERLNYLRFHLYPIATLPIPHVP